MKSKKYMLNFVITSLYTYSYNFKQPDSMDIHRNMTI